MKRESQVKFGRYMKALREKRDLTIRALAEKAGLEATGAMISFIETGRRSCGPQLAEKLVTALNLSGEERQEFYRRAATTTPRPTVRGDAAIIAETVLNSLMHQMVSANAKIVRIEQATAKNKEVDFIVHLDNGQRYGLELKVKEFKG